jgi:hypothetical protein
MLLMAEEDVVVTEWSTCAPTARAVVRSCRKFEKHWHTDRAIHPRMRHHGVGLC